jgi:high-affinity nickel-transport protein
MGVPAFGGAGTQILADEIRPVYPSQQDSALHDHHPRPPVSSRPTALLARIRHTAHTLHARTPLLHRLPASAVFIILLLAFLNCLIWGICAIPLRLHPSLLSPALLAYTLGLRHALDADHISAIDLITRRLVSAADFNVEKAPVTVGTFFSLGHSTVVIVTAIVVAATASSISTKWDGFQYVGGIVGSSVSAAVLVGFGIVNAWVLVGCVRRLRAALRTVERDEEGEELVTEMAGSASRKKLKKGGEVDIEEHMISPTAKEENDLHIHGGGCLIVVFKKLFRLIDRPWKTYPLGILFGLGFDTSSEIALLALSSLQAASGTSLWLILVFPVLFTIGMCLLDTMDGALMMALYTSALRTGRDGQEKRDEIAPLYYNTILTTTTVIVALVIGTFQSLALATAVLGDRATGGAWDGVNDVLDHWEAIGGGICGLFVVAGITSVVCYKPWRRWLAKRAEKRRMSPNNVDWQ